MIPGYSQKIETAEISKVEATGSLEEQIRQLQEQVRSLRETVEYMNRERSRMKSELDSIRHVLSK